MRNVILALAGTFLVLSFDAFGIEVGSVAAARFESSYTLDGSQLTDTRAKLLHTSNFGPLGTVGEAINITDVDGPIDFTTLSTFDVFFIGYFSDGSPSAFTDEELLAMENWVNAGGTMVITCDDTGHDAVCNAFGPVPDTPNATPPVEPTAPGLTHPVFDGPFGTPSELGMAGTIKYFADTSGFTVLGADQGDHPVVLEELIGDGRVIVFTDVNIISDGTLSGGTGISNDNDEFLGNLFAYLADEAVETFSINAGLNGNWWNGPDRGGEGVQLEVVLSGGDLTVVATFYSYDTEGNQIFLIAVGEATGNAADVTVYITEGGLWGEDFDPDLVNEDEWGTGTFTADSCNQVHMSLNPNAQYEALGYTNLAYNLQRLTIPAAPCPMAGLF